MVAYDKLIGDLSSDVCSYEILDTLLNALGPSPLDKPTRSQSTWATGQKQSTPIPSPSGSPTSPIDPPDPNTPWDPPHSFKDEFQVGFGQFFLPFHSHALQNDRWFKGAWMCEVLPHSNDQSLRFFSSYRKSVV